MPESVVIALRERAARHGQSMQQEISQVNLLVEDAKVSDRLLHLLQTVECSGKPAHDANVVAAMLAHGVDTVVTLDTADFARFGARWTSSACLADGKDIDWGS